MRLSIKHRIILGSLTIALIAVVATLITASRFSYSLFSKLTKENRVYFVEAIDQILHQSIGKLEGDLRFKVLQDMMAAINHNQPADTFVMDTNGTIIAPLERKGENIMDRRDDSGFFYIKEICQKKTGSRYFKLRENNKRINTLFAYRQLTGHDWILVSSISLDAVRAPFKPTFVLVISIGVAIFLLAMLLSAIFARSVGDGFSGLTWLAKKIADGRFDLIEMDVLSQKQGRRQNWIGRWLSRSTEVVAVDQTMRSMGKTLGSILQGITGISDGLANSVTQAHLGSRTAVEVSKQQTGKIANVVSRLEQISSSVNSVNRDISSLNKTVESSVHSSNELSHNLHTLTDEVTQFTLFVEQTGSTVASMSEKATLIAENVSKVAAAAEGTSQVMSEQENAIRSIDKTSRESASLAQEVALRAHAGQDAVQKSIEGMDHIRITFDGITEAVAALGERVEDIKNILTVIQDISRQTNLLALNASILAAQAGEHGRGFSVVAGEIKALSDRTNQATNEIANLIESVHQERQRTTQVMSTGLVIVREGRVLSGAAGKAIEAILELTLEANEQMADIASSTREQVQGNLSIMHAVERIVNMSRMALDLTQEQHLIANEVSSRVENVHSTLASVRQGLNEESRKSKEVATQIAAIANLSDRIDQENNKQGVAEEQILQDVNAIRGGSKQIVAQTETLVVSVSGLSGRISELNNAVTKFRVQK